MSFVIKHPKFGNILAQVIDQKIWFKMNDQTYCIDIKEPKIQRGSAAQKPGDCRAPMPGKITKILNRNGELIKSGQTVLVIEAMKMEYNINAPIDGELEISNFKIGDRVQLGQTLFEVKNGVS